MKNENGNKGLHSLVIMIIALLSIVTVNSLKAEAKETNIQDTGSLTIHKLLNPNYLPGEAVGENEEFKGDGTNSGSNANGGNNITGKPLKDVEFTIVGPLTDAQIAALEGTNGYITTGEAIKFINTAPAGTTKYSQKTGIDGTAKFTKLPVNTKKLNENRWLVVETDTPDHVDGTALPVIVNVPVPTIESEQNAYNYDVHLFMKNYVSDEPEIEKEIDKPTHSTGDRVLYELKINNLPDDIGTFERLEVYDALDKRLSLIGKTPYTESIGEVTLKAENGTVKKTFKSFITDKENLNASNIAAGNDLIIRTGKAKEKGKGQYIYWSFTKEGIAKLVDSENGDYIELPFEAIVNDKATNQEAILNQGELGFENDWGYGTKPTDPVTPDTPVEPGTPIPVPQKPSEIVSTIYGKKNFIKTDADSDKVLPEAEFIVKDVPVKDVNTFDAKGNKLVLPAGVEIYAVIEKGRVVRWTADKAEATPIVSGTNGKFAVDGLAYTNEVNYSKQYIFKVMTPLTTLNDDGEVVVYQPEKSVVKEYTTVAAKVRTAATTAGEINAEIQSILDKNNDWVFYKESETNPAQIDYLGAVIHDYALEETKAPQGYVPLPTDIKFIVPGVETGKDENGRPVYDTTEVAIPNKKLPGMPITGGVGTIIFLIVGVVFIGFSYYLRRSKTV